MYMQSNYDGQRHATAETLNHGRGRLPLPQQPLEAGTAGTAYCTVAHYTRVAEIYLDPDPNVDRYLNLDPDPNFDPKIIYRITDLVLHTN